jgi:NAD-dependent SIR2 family protein deacetylase
MKLHDDHSHANRIRAIHGRPAKALCPDCGSPTHAEPGDYYAPTVRVCGRCGWDDYADRLATRIARSDEGALYGDAHTADTSFLI